MITKEDLTIAIKEIGQRMEASQKEVDIKMKETQETLKKVTKLVGSIGNNQGDVAEEFFYNSLADKPELAGIKYDFVDKNITRKRGDTEDEYDIVMINGKDVAIIEVKYKAHIEDVKRLIERKYENFKKLYPEYKDYNHRLALASFNINQDIKDFAFKNSVMLLQRKGDIIETIEPE